MTTEPTENPELWWEQWRYVPVRKDDGTSMSKVPALKEWQHNLKTMDEMSIWTGNWGLKTGVDSNNTISLDCDGDGLGDALIHLIEARIEEDIFLESEDPLVILLEKVLKSTRFVSSPNRIQILLRIEGGDAIAKSRIFVTKFPALVDYGMMIEILANGQQTVIPPSVCSKTKGYQHEARVWEIPPSELQTLTFDEWTMFYAWLKNECEEQVKVKSSVSTPDSVYAANDATVTNILSIIEQSGAFRDQNRHEFTLCLCANLMEYGITKETTETIVTALVETNGGDIDDLLTVVEYSYKVRYYRGNMIKRLEEMMQIVD